MTPEQQIFLNLKILPARVSAEQAAWYLGFESAAIPILVARRLLDPLGNPPPNAMKHFQTTELERLRGDRRWLARATGALYDHWQSKNARCRERRRRSPGSDDCLRSKASTRCRPDGDHSSSTQQ